MDGIYNYFGFLFVNGISASGTVFKTPAAATVRNGNSECFEQMQSVSIFCG